MKKGGFALWPLLLLLPLLNYLLFPLVSNANRSSSSIIILRRRLGLQLTTLSIPLTHSRSVDIKAKAKRFDGQDEDTERLLERGYQLVESQEYVQDGGGSYNRPMTLMNLSDRHLHITID